MKTSEITFAEQVTAAMLDDLRQRATAVKTDRSRARLDAEIKRLLGLVRDEGRSQFQSALDTWEDIGTDWEGWHSAQDAIDSFHANCCDWACDTWGRPSELWSVAVDEGFDGEKPRQLAHAG